MTIVRKIDGAKSEYFSTLPTVSILFFFLQKKKKNLEKKLYQDVLKPYVSLISLYNTLLEVIYETVHFLL